MAMIQIEQDSPETVAQVRWKIQEVVQRVADSADNQYRHGERMHLNGWILALMHHQLLSVKVGMGLSDEAHAAIERAWV
ncbi:hypothetical protein QYE73_22760 [Pseudomonas mosselii]|uniref:hypothetical protein n=1 Tax=Pseudomonas mosselii TaxID=78327 RepID=UPI0026204290|nr:hypothetical protein [Pseudomonas mosselii]MDN4500113.1 hypothetical protein [Pseudomonas mosselii]